MTADIHLAEYHLRQGDAEAAYRIAKDTAALAKKLDRNGNWGRALVLMARAMAEKGDDLKEAIALTRKAQSLIEKEALPDELWRLQYHLACLLKQAGKKDESARVMSAAKTILNQVLAKVPEQYKDNFVAWGEGTGFALPTSVPPVADQAHRQMRDLTRLMEINRELTREHDPKRLLPLIMKYAVELTGAERGMIVMPRDNKLEQVFSHKISDALDVRFSNSVAEKVIDEGRSVLAIDALGDERFSAFVSVHTMKLRSILAVPLQIRSRIVGVIYLDSRLRAGVFSDNDLGLLEAFSAQAAIALETSRLISENANRCTDLQLANEEILKLSMQLEKKLKRNEATLRRVGALLQKTQKDEATRLEECGIVGRSPAMQEIMRIVDRIALTDAPVYIFGASGTGKELVAKAIHATSERSEHPFVPINCGALPPKLLASELFGHAKGAFTGAIGDRPGLFRLADKGTLLLDEVADMDASMQAHLLRVLQDGTFRPVGGNEEISVDVRILSASNRDLEKEMQAGRFREDLFYRLNVVRVNIPPLTGRKEDIPLLVDHFANHHAIKEKPTFSANALDRLISADWPGNVRELENEVLRVLTMATPGKPIAQKDLSPRLRGPASYQPRTEGGSLKQRTDSFERVIIQKVLDECDGNASRAAEKLGISRAGLYKKLDKHGIRK
jgi:transcriptional regulator with GAF, ATPase, and Fis domain/DNA-binding XRE family transcriptional regulator